MKLFYIPYEKKTGRPICILNKSELLHTTKGVTKAWKDHDFTDAISGKGDIIMEWVDTNKEQYGKSCVLTVSNYESCEIDNTLPEKRNWFCKGNFKKDDLKDSPIVVSNGVGKERQNTNKVEYKDVYFSLALNNAISKERQSGASTILRVFQR